MAEQDSVESDIILEVLESCLDQAIVLSAKLNESSELTLEEDDSTCINPISTTSSNVERNSSRASSLHPIERRGDWLNELFMYASYFIVRSINNENVMLSKQLNVWSTPRGNERRLNRVFRKTRKVILIFSVSESHRFHGRRFCIFLLKIRFVEGFAMMLAEANHDSGIKVNWRLPPAFNVASFTGIIKLDWICKNELSFLMTTHLTNSWNGDRPVKFGRDGQGVDPICGEALCRLMMDSGVSVGRPIPMTVDECFAPRESPSTHLPFNTMALFGVAEEAFDGSYEDYVRSFEQNQSTPPAFWEAPQGVEFDREIVRKTLLAYIGDIESKSAEETSERARTLVKVVRSDPAIVNVLVRGILNAFAMHADDDSSDEDDNDGDDEESEAEVVIKSGD